MDSSSLGYSSNPNLVHSSLLMSLKQFLFFHLCGVVDETSLRLGFSCGNRADFSHAIRQLRRIAVWKDGSSASCCCCCIRRWCDVTWRLVHERTPEQPWGLRPRLKGLGTHPQKHEYVLRPSPGTLGASALLSQHQGRSEGILVKRWSPLCSCRPLLS